MRIWKLMSNTIGEVSILGPPLGRNEKIFVVDARAMRELMAICDRHLLLNGQERELKALIQQIDAVMPSQENAG